MRSRSLSLDAALSQRRVLLFTDSVVNLSAACLSVSFLLCAQALRADSSVTVRDLVRVLGASAYQGLGELEYGLRAAPGAPTPFAHANKGQGWWELMESSPQKRAMFASAMTAVDSFSLQALVEDYPWASKLCGANPSTAGRVVDVAGSLGSVLKNVLRTVPSARGVLFDLPSVVPLAQQVWAKDNQDLLERVQFVGGSFFDSGAIPAAQGANDVYILRNILHDWDDQRSAEILRSLRTAIGSSGAKLVIIEVRSHATARRCCGRASEKIIAVALSLLC